MVHAIAMRADRRGAKALIMCVACVNAHTQETMGVCACIMCVQAVENVDFVFDIDVCVQMIRMQSVCMSLIYLNLLTRV